MALELMVMPLSRYLAGDFMTPAMRAAWASNAPYRRRSPGDPVELAPNTPWGGDGAARRRDDVLTAVHDWLANLPAPIPAQLWDERDAVAPSFHRIEDDRAWRAFQREARARTSVATSFFGLRKRPPVPFHTGATVLLPCAVAAPFEMFAPLHDRTGSAAAALAELDRATWPPATAAVRDVFAAALRDALALKQPLILVEVDDAPPAAARPHAVETVTDQDSIDAFVRIQVRAGFRDRDDILEAAIERLAEERADTSDDELQTLAAALLARAEAELAQEQVTWPEVTDNDKLDACFAALEADGIIVREDFTCCSNCARGEIWNEIGAAEALGREVRGYAYFHQQDTERAVATGKLMLGFWSNPEDGDPVAVGDRIVATLAAAGLETTWDGTDQQRIEVALTWRVRVEDSAVSIT